MTNSIAKASFIQPNRLQIHTDQPLTNVSIAFFQDATNFIADRVFPTIPVSKSTNIYYTIPRGELNRLMVKQRARGARPAGATHMVGQDSYNCRSYALKESISVEDRADADDPLDLDVQSTEFLTTQGLLNREVDWVDTYFKTGVWGTDITGVASGPTGAQVLQWNDDASTPIEDVQAGKTQILSETGFVANTLVLGYEVYAALRNHPDIVDRIKYGQTSSMGAAVLNEDVLAQVLDVDRILIGRAIRNTANEGATDAHSFVAGKAALLCYSAPNPGLRVPSAGYTFAWNVYSATGMRIRRFSEDPAVGEDIIMDDAFDQKLVAADLGYFWTTVVA